MTNDVPENIVARLDALVDEEREVLMAGDLQRLAPLLAEKQALIDQLNATDAAAAGLDALKAKVARNQAMLDGAMQGIRAVTARMSALRKIRQSLETYDETGRRRTIRGDGQHSVERRA